MRPERCVFRANLSS